MGYGELIGIGAGIAGNLAGNAMGMSNQSDLMAKQYNNQKLLNIQQQKLNLDTWEKTNFKAQVDQMKKAGLNVGMMYGMSGGSGGTLGSGSSGTASGGNAPHMDLGSIVTEARLAESTMKLQEAQARKLNADAGIVEMDADTKKNYGKAADMYEADNRGRQALAVGSIQFGDIKDEGKPIDRENRAQRNLINENKIKDAETRIKLETEETVKSQMRQDLMNSELDAVLKDAGIDLTREQEKKIWHDIWQGWTNAGFNGLGKIINGMILNKMKK